ncbi:hypothetical protein DN241_13555, partial [Salmonella enterica subsp. enterica]|nr:hypothetical protein [Salmonella enterica subsp. enterica serovar Newport]
MVCQPKAHRVATGTAMLNTRKTQGYFGSFFLGQKNTRYGDRAGMTKIASNMKLKLPHRVKAQK